MKKIIVLLFFFFILFWCSNEYTNNYKEKNEIKTQNISLDKNLNEFSFEKIWYLSWISIKETPDTKFLEELVLKINKAEKKVYVEVYIFTEKRLKKALIDAKKRWLDVKVLLEKNVYMAWNLNKDTFEDFKKVWIDVSYWDDKDYSLNHTKLILIDEEFVLSTWNYSYSTFKYNREFFIFWKNKEIYEVLLNIFDLDFTWNKNYIYHNNLVLSPYYSRYKMEYLINNAKKSLKIYVLNFWDKNMHDLIIKAKKRWVDIEIVFPSSEKVDSNTEEINKFKSEWIKIYQLKKPEIHAKAILTDEKYLYIWSINFSEASMDKNREIWLLISNNDIIKYFLTIFKKDFIN